MSTPELFVGYSHKDQVWKDKITTFLRVLERAEQISFKSWTDSDISLGADWENAILKAINGAKVTLLLISVDFLDSEFIMKTEIPEILKQEKNGQLVIVPFVIRPCPWEYFDWIRSTQGYVDNTMALSGQNEYNREIILTKLIREISRTVTDSREITEHEAYEMEEMINPDLSISGWEEPDRLGSYFKGQFLTNAGVTNLVENSSKIHSRVVGLIRIFQTRKQNTWFVATQTHLCCVLDDEKTSAGGRQIQWELPLSETEPIRTKQRKDRKSTGLVDVGRKLNWLYSLRLHPDAHEFENAIRNLVEHASAF